MMNKYIYMVYHNTSSGMASLKHFSNKAKATAYVEELRILTNNGDINMMKQYLF